MKYFIVLFLLLAQTTPGYAADTALPDDYPELRQMLAKIVPNAKPDRITPTPAGGLYEVVYGTQILYATKDGRYVIHGDIIDVSAHSNITEDRRSGVRMNALNKISEDQMIIFAPEKIKHTITVFTDIDCGYCRKMHSEIDSYLKEGIRVRYLSFPRSGVDTPSYNKTVSVWCAKDRKAALTRAKMGEPVEQKSCGNPVNMEMELGEQMGVEGTPTMITDTGRLLAGYVPAARMAQMLAEDKKKNSGSSEHVIPEKTGIQ